MFGLMLHNLTPQNKLLNSYTQLIYIQLNSLSQEFPGPVSFWRNQVGHRGMEPKGKTQESDINSWIHTRKARATTLMSPSPCSFPPSLFCECLGGAGHARTQKPGFKFTLIDQWCCASPAGNPRCHAAVQKRSATFKENKKPLKIYMPVEFVLAATQGCLGRDWWF